MGEQAERRKLSFDSLEAVVEDAEQLLASGYEKLGEWSLAQACGHIADWMRYPMDGFEIPIFIRPMLWLMKVTRGKSQLRKVLANGNMPDGMPTVKQSIPAPIRPMS